MKPVPRRCSLIWHKLLLLKYSHIFWFICPLPFHPSPLPEVFSHSDLTFYPASTLSIWVLPSLIHLQLLFLRQMTVTHVFLYTSHTSLFSSSISAIIFFVCFIQLLTWTPFFLRQLSALFSKSWIGHNRTILLPKESFTFLQCLLAVHHNMLWKGELNQQRCISEDRTTSLFPN